MHNHDGTQICDQAHRQAQAQAQMHGQAHIILTSIFTTGLWSCLGSAILTMAPAVGPELAIPTTAPVVASGLAHTHDGVSTSTTAPAVASELGHTHDGVRGHIRARLYPRRRVRSRPGSVIPTTESVVASGLGHTHNGNLRSRLGSVISTVMSVIASGLDHSRRDLWSCPCSAVSAVPPSRLYPWQDV
jgi:hypothetical protein